MTRCSLRRSHTPVSPGGAPRLIRPSGHRGAGAGAGRGPCPRPCAGRSVEQIQTARIMAAAATAGFSTPLIMPQASLAVAVLNSVDPEAGPRHDWSMKALPAIVLFACVASIAAAQQAPRDDPATPRFTEL